jgi:small nuclear ribonucleoprotein D3
MNVQLKDITVTARDGRVSHLDQVYIRGSHVRFFIVPDMLRYDSSFLPLLFSAIFSRRRLCNVSSHLPGCSSTNVFAICRNAPMFRTRGQRGRGVGLARGKATVNRARGQRRG